MAILENAKELGLDIFRASGSAVGWITTKSGIPLKSSQIFATTLLIVCLGVYLTQSITNRTIKYIVLGCLLWIGIGFFM